LSLPVEPVMTRTRPGLPVVDLSHDDRMTGDERDVVHGLIGAVLMRHEITDQVRARALNVSGRGRPAVVQVNLRVFGAPARIQVPGATFATAVGVAAARLDRQIRRLTTGWERWPWPDPERRPLGLPGEGRITRLKSYRFHVGMPCQATAVMNAMDYDVFVFTDAETGEDAVIYRAGPTGVRLARQRTMRPPAMPVTLPLTINPRRTMDLTVRHAAGRLAEGQLPWLFFTNRESGRGNLVYRRYDGDLGLIAPQNDGR